MTITITMTRALLEQALEALELPSMKTERMLVQRDAAIEAIRAHLARPQGEPAAMSWRDEVERLRADAERYRWLRDMTPWTAVSAFDKTRVAFRLASKFSEEETPEAGVDLDAAIDAAMKEQP